MQTKQEYKTQLLVVCDSNNGNKTAKTRTVCSLGITLTVSSKRKISETSKEQDHNTSTLLVQKKNTEQKQ